MTHSRRGFAGLTWLGLGLVTLTILAVVLLLSGGRWQSSVVAANVRDIQAGFPDYRDKQVIVTGRVEEVLTHRALTLGSDLAGEPLLVLVDKSALVNGYELGGSLPLMHGQMYQEQDVVQFLGTLDEFQREPLAERLDIVLNEELFGGMEGSPVLVVERLDVAAYGGIFPSPAPLEAASLDPGEATSSETD